MTIRGLNLGGDEEGQAAEDKKSSHGSFHNSVPYSVGAGETSGTLRKEG